MWPPVVHLNLRPGNVDRVLHLLVVVVVKDEVVVGEQHRALLSTHAWLAIRTVNLEAARQKCIVLLLKLGRGVPLCATTPPHRRCG